LPRPQIAVLGPAEPLPTPRTWSFSLRCRVLASALHLALEPQLTPAPRIEGLRYTRLFEYVVVLSPVAVCTHAPTGGRAPCLPEAIRVLHDAKDSFLFDCKPSSGRVLLIGWRRPNWLKVQPDGLTSNNDCFRRDSLPFLERQSIRIAFDAPGIEPANYRRHVGDVLNSDIIKNPARSAPECRRSVDDNPGAPSKLKGALGDLITYAGGFITFASLSKGGPHRVKLLPVNKPNQHGEDSDNHAGCGADDDRIKQVGHCMTDDHFRRITGRSLFYFGTACVVVARGWLDSCRLLEYWSCLVLSRSTPAPNASPRFTFSNPPAVR
jgi:hypothetical protein